MSISALAKSLHCNRAVMTAVPAATNNLESVHSRTLSSLSCDPAQNRASPIHRNIRFHWSWIAKTRPNCSLSWRARLNTLCLLHCLIKILINKVFKVWYVQMVGKTLPKSARQTSHTYLTKRRIHYQPNNRLKQFSGRSRWNLKNLWTAHASRKRIPCGRNATVAAIGVASRCIHRQSLFCGFQRGNQL